ncbi:carboxypeptidase-like regulatory domain-containing protein [Bosea caraganae]|uniref:carboxypeptidase-like regulatory domain-containing protein n=1 Tax=Bosea caraganae TaxID=2763117 RepID=UPI0015F0D717|nr:carboxypeptidase-like regulatory domain-containing protein [Bosea caraganae]
MSDAEPVLHRGRVTTPDGAGASAALVFVASGTASTPEIAIRCDADGWFRLALPPGRFVIEARAPDGRTGKVEVTTGAVAQELAVAVD